mmetsp:Transcript_114765/g.297437  ORF Transcript_114765/g.297437 Transcript_114765/m.297437 type:complete len:275 (-) Transcript_114765:17-841(-)
MASRLASAQSLNVGSPEVRALAMRLSEMHTLRDQDNQQFAERLDVEKQSREQDMTEVWARLELLEGQLVHASRPQQRDAGQKPTSMLSSFLGTKAQGDGRGSGGSAELQQLERVRDEVEQGRRSMESDKAALEQAKEATQSVIAQAADAVNALSGALQRAEQVRTGSNSADAAAPTLLSVGEVRSKKVIFASGNDAGASEGRYVSDLQAQVDQLATELHSVRTLVNEINRKMMTHAVLTTRAALRASDLTPRQRSSALQELNRKAGSMDLSTSP